MQTAKILKYMQFQLACDITFGIFMVIWLLTRHILYLRVVYSIYEDIPKEITYGCYSGSSANMKGPFDPPDQWLHLLQPFRDPEGVVCWNNNIKWAFIYALLALQVILCIWFGMVIRVAVRVLRGGEADDTRSDDEGEEDETEDPIDNDEMVPKWEKADLEMTPSHHRENLHELPIEEVVGAEELSFTSHRQSPPRRFRKAGGMASGVNLHSDRKELLGRIGCDKPPE